MDNYRGKHFPIGSTSTIEAVPLQRADKVDTSIEAAFQSCPQNAKASLYHQLKQARRLYEDPASAVCKLARCDSLRKKLHPPVLRKGLPALESLPLVSLLSVALRLPPLHRDAQLPRVACAAPVSSKNSYIQVSEAGIKCAHSSLHFVLP